MGERVEVVFLWGYIFCADQQVMRLFQCIYVCIYFSGKSEIAFAGSSVVVCHHIKSNCIRTVRKPYRLIASVHLLFCFLCKVVALFCILFRLYPQNIFILLLFQLWLVVVAV